MSETLSNETRRMLTDLAEMLVGVLPNWRSAILFQARRGDTYEEWRKRFQPFAESGMLKAVLDRIDLRGEDHEEVLKFFWQETRRVARETKIQ